MLDDGAKKNANNLVLHGVFARRKTLVVVSALVRRV
jgi:hypothetical protein